MRVLNTCARAQKARFLLMASGNAGKVYAAATGLPDSTTLHADDDDHVTAGLHALANAHAALPLVFPYSTH